VTVTSALAGLGTILTGTVSILATYTAAATAPIRAAAVGGEGTAGILTRLAERLLPRRHRTRYREEWRAELAELAGWARVKHAWGLLTRAPLVAWGLRYRGAPRRSRLQFVVSVNEIAQINGWVAGAFLMEQAADGVRYRLEYARRQENDLRIVVLTRFCRRDSPDEIRALLREAVALGRKTRTRVCRKARRAGGFGEV